MNEAPSTMSLDIVVLTKNRLGMFALTLRSIELAVRHLSAKFGTLHLKIAVKVGVNGRGLAGSEYRLLVNKMSAQAANSTLQFQVVELSDELPGASRNELICQSKADWLFFCDDDVILNEKIFTHFSELLTTFPEVRLAGGPNLNVESENSNLDCCVLIGKNEIAQSAVLGSALFVGPFARRYRALQSSVNTEASIASGAETARSLTLCKLFWRREPSFRFPQDFFCGEEMPLISAGGGPNGKVILSPGLSVQHFRRKSLRAFLIQSMKYGVGRGQFDKFTSIAGAALLLLVICAAWMLPAAILGLMSLYFVYLFAAAFLCVSKEKISMKFFFSIISAGVSLHVRYLIGLIIPALPLSRKVLQRSLYF
jgi:hypothetical protein